jgi:hypothetical protein
MHAFRHLGRLHDNVQARFRYLQRVACGCTQPTDNSARQRVAFVVLESHNCWAAFMRSYYLSCIYRARRINKPRVKVGFPGITTEKDAIAFAATKVAGRKWKTHYTWSDEPKWHDRSTMTRLATLLSFSNQPEIAVALNITANVFTDLTVFRHFFAHRGMDTVRKARALAPKYAQRSDLHPCDIVTGVEPGRTQNIMADWVADLRTTVELLCD